MIARRWFAALGYVALIYATLGWAPRPLAYLRSHNVLRLTLRFLFLSFVATLFLRLILSRTKDAWHYIAAATVAGVYYLLASRVPIPEERIHFLEYGLVGVLFARALRSHTNQDDHIAWGAFFLGTLAGAVDEWIQKLIPNRHYDPKDILLNAIAVTLGLAVYYLLLPSRSSTSSTPD